MEWGIWSLEFKSEFFHFLSRQGVIRHSKLVTSNLQNRHPFPLKTGFPLRCNQYPVSSIQYRASTHIVGLQLEELFGLRGYDVVEFILGHVNIGDILFPPVEEMRQDHPVDGPVADDHDVLGVAA